MSSPRTLTIRLDARRQAQVRRLAERAGVSEEEAVLRAVEQAAPEPSMLEAFGDAIGSFSGPPDLSTNPVYMDGYGEPRGATSAQTNGADD